MIAFGGFIFGWDTNQFQGLLTKEISREGLVGLAKGRQFQLSDVRTGLIVGIFNIGCALGGLTLGTPGGVYGRKSA
ncbi:CNT_collapsed_G0015710.mRNA.1.CDS.1 [Saccharomyces cerevisiae]|nr:CNT_collapsed_G0015710.mRNA.1.CDS.1 [Saccharomyces cerevisiae]